KGGGVKVVKSADEAKAEAERMMSSPLVTKQTGEDGVTVRKVLVEEGCDIQTELYLGITLDRNQSTPVVMASTEGGVEIEEVAESNPDAILKEAFDPETGLQDYQARRLAFGLGLTGKTALSAATLIAQCARAFQQCDASLVEINPLVITGEGKAIALDAKFSFEENALPRHPQYHELRDLDEEDPNEIKAKEFGLSYIQLDGNIGCLVNGAGLAMSTLDVIRQEGAWPANFLDVGGGADKDQVKGAFSILLGDPKVEAILVNIFGGIMSCAVIAEGIIAAAKEIELTVPLVVRLEGNASEEGRALIDGSGLPIQSAGDLDDAAAKAVAAAKGAK
ncbi:MAG: ADP-forming succinate--CoA ligase subunit beta, partial [Planctomycetota bacterium]